MTLKDLKIVKEELDKLLEVGIVTLAVPANHAWSFPIVRDNKKDGKPRLCVDYRELNRKMKVYRWPLPMIQEIFDDFAGSEIFSTLDFFRGYWQILMCKFYKEKTTFVCRFGTFQFEVMPFGLMNAPSTFQRLMNKILRGLEKKMYACISMTLLSSPETKNSTFGT